MPDEPRRLGPYVIEGTLGRGAAGVVYRARHEELKRPVALKVLRESAAEPGLRERFHREAMAAARLRHPNIVSVHDAGQIDGEAYIAMELVEGSTLDDAIEKKRLPLRQVVETLAKVADAVHHAHAQGVIHRDLKPGNILIDASGEPRVVDFGLARVAQGTLQLTRTGTAVGTPLYMSPEQVRGLEVGPPGDVWSLGVILYQAMTGRFPFPGATLDQVYRGILFDDPIAPRRLNAQVSEDLVTVCLRALEKDAALRYPTARALAEDLRRWLDGHAVAARPRSTLRRTLAVVGRHRAAASAAAVAVAALAVWLVSGAVSTARRVRGGLDRAARLEAAGDLAKARDAYSGVLDVDRANADARVGVERIERKSAEEEAARQRRLREAMALLEQGRPGIDEAIRARYRASLDYGIIRARVEQAQAFVERGLSGAPELPLGHYLLGRAWELRGEWDAAEACWREAIRLDPDFGPARHQLARLLLERSYVSAIYLPGVEDAQKQARSEASARLAAEAAREFEAAAAAGTGFNDDLQRTLADAQLAAATGQWEKLNAVLKGSFERFGGREGIEELLWFSSLYFLKLNDFGRMKQSLDRALQIRPHYPLALFCRGTLLIDADPRAAVDDFSRLIAIVARLADAWFCRANARSNAGDAEGCIADHTRALEINPRHLGALCNRGGVRLRRGDAAGALEDFTRAIEIEPRAGWPYACRGDAHHERRDLAQAIADYTKAIELGHERPAIVANRGLTREEAGDVEGAIADLRRSLEIAPRDWKNREVIEARLKRALEKRK